MEYDLWIAGGILAIGILLFFFLANRKKYRTPSEAKNYNRIRERLTLRELAEEYKEEEVESTDIAFNTDFDPFRVIRRIVTAVLSLYVGSVVMKTFAEVAKGTSSPFYEGLKLIGFQFEEATCMSNITTAYCQAGTMTQLTGEVHLAGIMSVMGIIIIAMILTEFISFDSKGVNEKKKGEYIDIRNKLTLREGEAKKKKKKKEEDKNDGSKNMSSNVGLVGWGGVDGNPATPF